MNTPRHNHVAVPSVLAWALVLLTTSSAFALDAYQDRRGVFSGVGVGVGVGKADADKAESQTGFNFRGRLGGGANKQLTLDGEVGAWVHFDDDQGASIYSGLLGVSYFPLDGLYVRGVGGASYLSVDEGESETGLAFGAGLGYEFFVDANLAIGIGADYLQHFYDDNLDFRVISFGINGTMY